MKICIVGISGKLGLYMTRHALARGHEVETTGAKELQLLMP
jgi:putative NADH-flavin reductase